jgi:hypothetical protein
MTTWIGEMKREELKLRRQLHGQVQQLQAFDQECNRMGESISLQRGIVVKQNQEISELKRRNEQLAFQHQLLIAQQQHRNNQNCIIS